MGGGKFTRTKSVVQTVICAAGAQFLRYGLETFRCFEARQETSIARVFMAQK